LPPPTIILSKVNRIALTQGKSPIWPATVAPRRDLL